MSEDEIVDILDLMLESTSLVESRFTKIGKGSQVLGSTFRVRDRYRNEARSPINPLLTLLNNSG